MREALYASIAAIGLAAIAVLALLYVNAARCQCAECQGTRS